MTGVPSRMSTSYKPSKLYGTNDIFHERFTLITQQFTTYHVQYRGTVSVFPLNGVCFFSVDIYFSCSVWLTIQSNPDMNSGSVLVAWSFKCCHGLYLLLFFFSPFYQVSHTREHLYAIPNAFIQIFFPSIFI